MTFLTIFTWGYDGWGSSTRQLKVAVDAVEGGRGFEPPYFVDLRISRSVRAEGFRENAFEKTVGRARYQWMPSLGNDRIKRRKGPRIQINEPAAVEELLGIALRRNAKRQRLLMFCQCPLPGRPRAHDRCHRVEVASLLLKAASKRNVSLRIGEWPGGQPQAGTLRVSDLQATKLKSGARSIVLGKRQPSIELLGLPWGSIVNLRSPSSAGRVIADSAVYRGGKWLLPVPFGVDASGADVRALKKKDTPRAAPIRPGYPKCVADY
jgi:hypothetical protein